MFVCKKQTSTPLPMTVSVCCHLDDRRGLFVRRDLAPLIFNSPRALVEMTAMMRLSVICTLFPIKNWVATLGDCQTEPSPRLNVQAGKSVQTN